MDNFAGIAEYFLEIIVTIQLLFYLERNADNKIHQKTSLTALERFFNLIIAYLTFSNKSNL
ncbi:hypothetical protein GCM10011346_46050 [Oceanobacillus neutriphilus]|uniref:Transposase n=1 Tax=Oceanobacillus neutriphilus TaxID=531815 RepID=A0ABQ2P1I3_9BACI|nr:hypothetical protein GCM10011346_46050 [Oceanobacillus neutriphilus]